MTQLTSSQQFTRQSQRHFSSLTHKLPSSVLLFLLLSTFLGHGTAALCDYTQDTCILEWQLDGVCDNQVDYEGCWEQDCWDCDACGEHDFTSCDACTQAGCVWCPGDGLCKSQALGADFWSLHSSRQSGCPTTDDWMLDATMCQEATTATTAVFSDPLYPAMAPSYRLIHVESVWQQGITGKGVHVRMNDVGLDASHAEFAGIVDESLSCDNFSPNSDPLDGFGMHGTGVASLLAAQGNNDECAVGISPGITLSVCTFEENFIEEELAAMLETHVETVDISSNSWGPEICFNVNYIRRLQRHRQRQRRQLQQSDPSDCIFNATHPESPCEACDSLDDPYAFVTSSSGSTACGQAIQNYCTNYYDNDPEACEEFLTLFTSCEYHNLSDRVAQAFVDGVTLGRQGKGIIYVFAGGNSYDLGAFTNSDGFINSRFTISVGATGKDGKHASYATTGSALFVTAPGGDFEFLANNIVAKPGGGCHDITGGTSFSAPVVSGVIALMLEANPNLGWRDVQHILAETSEQNDPTEDSWIINGAGIHHSMKYGFGMVNAAAAVEAAKTWINVGPEDSIILESSMINLTIPDDPTLPVTHSQFVTTTTTASTGSATATTKNAAENDGNSFVVESVVVSLDLLHASRGDLLVTLTSPSGTESILHPSRRPENRQLPNNQTWELMTVRNWKEDPNGAWTISIVDESKGNRHNECADEPFEHIYLSDSGNYAVYRCLNAKVLSDCRNGEILRESVVTEYTDRGRDGLTAAEACCVCGGGVPVSKVNMLRSWTLTIYGHERTSSANNAGEENDTTIGPTTAPTVVDQTQTSTTTAATNNSSLTTTIDELSGEPYVVFRDNNRTENKSNDDNDDSANSTMNGDQTGAEGVGEEQVTNGSIAPAALENEEATVIEDSAPTDLTSDIFTSSAATAYSTATLPAMYLLLVAALTAFAGII